MSVLSLDLIQTIALAVVVLLFGQLLVKRFSILEKYCIPTPVVGGLVFAIVALFLRQGNILAFEFDDTLQDVAMNAFFTSVGYSASMKVLKRGGKKVMVFLAAAVGLVVLQNVLGIGLASTMGLHPYIGLATGSVPMTGGHATAVAFGPVLEEAGATGANTIAIAAATFGLVAGSMMGGPVANRLIIKYKLASEKKSDHKSIKEAEETVVATEEAKPFIENNFFIAAFELLIAMGIGTFITIFFDSLDITLPGYIGAMIIGVLIRNIGEFTGKIPVPMEEIDVLGGIGLQLFLSMALMSLKLWELADLALQMLVLLAAQTVLMYLYANFITFRISGKDYDGAVLTAGHCGFGMGATPNGVANMTSVTAKWGPSPTAFFVLPIVGGMFIDFFNSGIITVFMNIF